MQSQFESVSQVLINCRNNRKILARVKANPGIPGLHIGFQGFSGFRMARSNGLGSPDQSRAGSARYKTDEK